MRKSLYIRICFQAFLLFFILMPCFLSAKTLSAAVPVKAGFNSILPAHPGMKSYASGILITDYNDISSVTNPFSLIWPLSNTITYSNTSNSETYFLIGSPIPAPPTITCPGNIVQSNDATLCTASVSGLAATINDPDGDITTLTWTMTGATFNASPLIGINNIVTPIIFNTGITTVTYIVTDAGGTSVSCSFTVTVNDTELPVVNCPPNVNATYGQGSCNATVAVGTAVPADNCGIAGFVGVRSDGFALNAPYPSGVTTITWTATDIHGNTNSCTQTVTVTQGVLLVNYNFIGATAYPISPNQSAGGIACQATSSEPFNILGTLGTLTGNLAFSNNTVANPSIYMDPSNFTNTRYFQFHISGDSLYKYRKFKLYVQARRGNRAAQTINFAYSTDPFSYTVNSSMSLISSGVWYEKVVDWSTVSLINNRPDLYIRLFASNGTGGIGDNRLFIDNFQVVGIDGPLARPNFATIPENTPVVVPVLVNDYFGCNGPAPVLPISITSYPAQGTVTLNPDSTFTYTPNPNVNGTDSFIYQICDASGSCDTSIVNITISPVSYAPIVSCPGNINSGSDIGVCGAQVNDLSATIYDQDGNITTLTWIITGANAASSPPTGINNLVSQFFNFGVSTVKYTVVDAEGLSDTCSFTVNVIDSENPSIVCPNDSVFTIPNCATLTDTVTLIPPQIGDNCGILSLTSDAPLQFPVGSTAVIWTVTDINGNTSACEQIVIVNLAAPMNLAMSSTPVICAGNTNGSASVNVTGGTPPYTYSWNTVPVQTTQTAINLAVGTYTVIVTDFNGCSDTASVTVNLAPNSLAVSTSQTNVACFGQANGSAVATATGGTLPYSYSWNTIPVQTNANATNLAPGTYIVIVTDGAGCSVPDTVVITQPLTALAGSVTNTTSVICKGSSTGSVTVSGNGGTPPYQYSLNGGAFQGSGTFSNLAAGNYTITVRDANNCLFDIPVTITEPAVGLTASITSQTSVLCAGQANGSATVTASGGILPYTYSWNTVPVQTGTTAINLAAGVYIVTVTDSLGCSVPVSVTITQPNPITILITKVDIACFGQATGSATALASGGTPPYTYAWLTVPIQTTATVNNLAAGTYTVAVFDSLGCFMPAFVTITQPASALSATITNQLNIICAGTNTGSVTVAGSGGTSPYQYSINGGAFQPGGTFNNLAAGNYTVTVRDANNCIFDIPVTITEPANGLTATITGQVDVLCSGQANGSAIVTASGGVLPYTYSWNTVPVQTNDTASNLPAGVYIVTVTDFLGCTKTDTVAITQPDPITILITKVDIACFGQATGSATALASGGTPPYTFAWLTVPIQTTATVNNLAAGTYTVAVFDSLGCFMPAFVTITQPASALSASITAQTNAECTGGNTGSFIVAGSGGTAPYQYSINGGAYQPGGTFSNLAAGVYTVSVIDANNCTFNTLIVTITGPAFPLTATITSQTNVLCSGQANGSAIVTVTGGVVPYTYSWNTVPVQTNDTASNLPAGVYIVTVTDFVGCVTTDTIAITQPDPISILITKVDIACFGQATGSATALASGGTPPYTYAWLTVPIQTTATVNNLAAGTYTVAVFDSLGCFMPAFVTITQPASALSASVTAQTNAGCAGGNTGSFTVSGSGGTAPYQYSINGGAYQPGGTFSNLAAGVYTVSVIDANNCTFNSLIVTITGPASPLTATITGQTNVLCSGQVNGSAIVTVTGGVLPYTYSWNTVPVQTNDTASNLPAGVYIVTVTDFAACVTTDTVTIIQPDPITILITKVDIACFGQATGSATALASGGTPPYTYAWLTVPIQTTATVNNLIAGTYTVAVFDSLGCFMPAFVTITQPASALTATITTQTNAGCAGGNTGSFTVSGSGGTAPYQYSINGGGYQPGGTFSNLAAGVYTVSVIDANNCTFNSLIVTITGPASPLTATITGQTNVLCTGQANGSAIVTVTGGVVPYTYSWNTVPVQTNDTASNLPAGVYIVTVTDFAACVTTDTVTIIQPDPITILITKVNVACFGQATGSATALASGGTPPYTYAWLTVPIQTTATVNNLVAGTYTVAVFDSLGCFMPAFVTITQPASALTATISSQTNAACIGGNTGSFTVVGSGGTAPYQYSINGGAYQPGGTFSNLAAGVYTVSVIDANNCTFNSLIVTITGPAFPLTATITGQTNVLCSGQANGSAIVTVSGGVLPYIYSWNTTPVQTNDTATNLPAGVYLVTVIDFAGCITTDTVTIVQPDPLAILITKVDVACFGQATGSATALASGGTPPYTYAWLTVPIQTTATVNNLVAGTYTVAVFDSLGCFISGTATINQPVSALTATIVSQDSVTCFGNATGSVTVQGVGGSPGYQYSIDGITYQFSGTFASLFAGNYTVTVKDTNNCVYNLPVEIKGPATGLTASFTKTDVFCFGEATGSVTVVVNSGIPPYLFSLNGGAQQAGGTFTNLLAGSYIVTVSDGSTCTLDMPFTILQPASALSTVIDSQIPVACFGGSTGSASVTASGGTLPYLYSWNTVPVQTNDTASGLAAGTYIVTVTDFNNCTTTDTVIITGPATPLSGVITNQVQEDCAGNANGSVTVSASGGTPGYQYSLNGNPYQAGGTFNNLSAGSYIVTVRDTNNCTVIVPVQITVSGILIAVDDFYSTPEDAPLSGNVMTNDLGLCFPPVNVTSNTAPVNGAVVVNVNGSFVYVPSLNYNGSDFFTYTITDSNGSDSTATVFITIDPFNDPPVTFNEYITVSYNLPESGNVLANGDYDPDGTSLTVNAVPVINPANGIFVIAADGSFTYTPNLNYIGSDLVVVSVCDAGIPLPPACTNDTIFINVLPPNQPPVTVNEYLDICQGTAFTGTLTNGGTVFNGDTDPENNLPLTVGSIPVLGPANGVFSITDTITGTFNYTPNSSYIGSDFVVVNICDSGIPVECSYDTIFFTVLPAIVANAGPGQMLCNADVTFLVGNSPVPGTGSWTFISGPNVPSIFPPTGSVAVVTGLIPSPIPYIFSYTVDNGVCAVSDTMSVLNYNPPTPSYAGIDQKFCNAAGNVSTLLSANTPVYGSGQWTQIAGPGTATILNAADPNTAVTNLTFGAYAFQWTISNGVCQVTADAVNIFITAPAVIDAGNSGIVCAGSTYSLSTATAVNYNTLLWTSSGTGTFSDPNVLNPIYIPSNTDLINGLVVLTLSATANDPCPDASDELTLIITPSPQVYAGADVTICGNMSYTVSDATAENCNSFIWTTSGAGVLSGSTTLTPTYTPALGETGDILLVLNGIATAPCANTSDNMIIHIISGITAYAGVDTAICENGTYKVTGALAINYINLQWQTSGTGVFSNASILDPVYTPSPNDINDGFVFLTLTAIGSAFCPEATDVMKLSIERIPVVYAGPDAIICQTSAFTVTQATAQHAANITWSTNGSGILTGGNTLTPVYQPAPGEAGIITLIMIADGNGNCGTVSDSVFLIIQPAVSVSAGTDISTCEMAPVQVSGSGVQNSTSILWTTSGNGLFSDPTIINPVYMPGSLDVASGIVMLTIRATASSPCPDGYDQVILTINKAPLVNAGPDITTCVGISSTISQANATNYSVIQWSLAPLSAGTLTNAGTLSPTFAPATGFSGTASLTFKARGIGACSDIEISDIMNVFVNTTLVADAGPDQTIYPGTAAHLTGSVTGGSGFYAWSWEPSSLLVNPSVENPISVALNSATTFTLTVMDITTGCTDDDIVDILVSTQGGSLVARADYDTTLLNVPVTVNVVANDINPDGEPLTVSFCEYPAHGIVVINSDNTITYSPYIDYEGDDTLCYKICSVNQPGICSDTMVYINIKRPNLDDLIVFNGVSTNGDGNNDIWKIKGIEKYPDNTVLIFNRWGDKVREFANYNNTSRSWDGNNEQGKPLPNGTYFYILDVKNVGVLKGWIFLRGEK